jgi:riboflavin biosynthesis pyrimidine reductase
MTTLLDLWQATHKATVTVRNHLANHPTSDDTLAAVHALRAAVDALTVGVRDARDAETTTAPAQPGQWVNPATKRQYLVITDPATSVTLTYRWVADSELWTPTYAPGIADYCRPATPSEMKPLPTWAQLAATEGNPR